MLSVQKFGSFSVHNDHDDCALEIIKARLSMLPQKKEKIPKLP